MNIFYKHVHTCTQFFVMFKINNRSEENILVLPHVDHAQRKVH